MMMMMMMMMIIIIIIMSKIGEELKLGSTYLIIVYRHLQSPLLSICPYSLLKHPQFTYA